MRKFFKNLFGTNEKEVESSSSAHENVVKNDASEITEINKESKTTSSFFVVGSKNYNLDKKVYEHIKSYGNKPYGNQKGNRIKEVVEDYGRIFKYRPMTSNKIELKHEPENPYDSNAIAVYFRNSKVGYIKKPETTVVSELLKEGKKSTARILGGPFKEFEDEFENNKLIEIDNSFNIEISFD